MRTDFTALTNGKAVITARRSACGEALRCKPDQTRFTVIVVVRELALPKGLAAMPLFSQASLSRVV